MMTTPRDTQLALFDAPIDGCLLSCEEHPEHVYILCYGRPTIVGDRDYVAADPSTGYPITHYVGWTRQAPPVRRIRAHGARSAHFVVQLEPGTVDNERLAKEIEACPKCGRSLWYYGESPTAPVVFELDDVVTVGERGRVRWRIAAFDARRASARLTRLDGLPGQRTVPTAHLSLRDRDPNSYRALQQAWQQCLAVYLADPSTENLEHERAAHAAVWAVATASRRD